MKYGYTRVSTKGQLDGNSIEEQANAIKNLEHESIYCYNSPIKIERSRITEN